MQINGLTSSLSFSPGDYARSGRSQQGEELTSGFDLNEAGITPADDNLATLRRPQLSAQEQQAELKDKFQDFVGQTFFSELIKSLRTSQQGAAYFNGGRAEEIFQGQFDQMMSEHLSDASAATISDPMFELFQLGRASG